MSPAATVLRSTLASAALLALMLHPAAAQHSGHLATGDTPPPAQATPATQAFQAVNAKRHQEMMAIDATGNAEMDYVKPMMVPHQGAIDRPRVVLQYGKDPTIRQLAHKIINDQESDIAQRRAWLKERGQ